LEGDKVIEIGKLTKSFKGKIALDHLDLRVAKGERIALMGHNGSGKTTLIRCLLGLHSYQGTIRVNGKDPVTARLSTLSEIGFVPQTPPALRMSVGEFTRLLCKLCHLTEDEVRGTALRMDLDLGPIWKVPFCGLSGGMKQKLLIAAALVRKPLLLIVDEPTANLDPKARRIFLDELKALSPESILLISSHRVDELAGIVTRLVELDRGMMTREEFLS
jgi:ABC-2 type transport system ATP-binding protein